MKQEIRLSDHFGYGRLIRFVLPSVGMMVFTSVYGVVDGFFVSNFVGKTPFAALNFIMPFLMILGPTGFLFGAGGSALVGKTMGEGDDDRACRLFSLFLWVPLAISCVIAALGIVFLPFAARFLGAEGEMLELAVLYGRIVLLANPAFTLQMEFQVFFVTAEKPRLGFWFTVMAGVANMALDALFLGVFRWGLAGAAAATAVSQAVGGFVPLIYFALPNTSRLHIRKCKWDGKAVLKAVGNGSSELMSNISMSVVGMLYNVQLMRCAGEEGVAAYGVLMYVNMVFIAIFIGFSIGSAPVISFHYGAENRDELRSLRRKSALIIAVSSVLMLGFSLGMASPLSRLFVGYDRALYEMTLRGFLIHSFCYLFAGTAIFGSGFFTALNNGGVSAAISFLRTVVFEVGAVLILPALYGLDGVWFATVTAEAAAFAVTEAFYLANRRRYGY
ncbi:MAG: MATE family efflux transporter [Clostridia bacterium]|nr:MATE family efflux transporter [Clostridia bacterium]